jgi:cytoskeletal protein RodZ
MEKLFDLDELHASYRKKKFRNVSIAVLIFIVVVIGLVSLVPHTRNSNAAVNLTGLANPINRDASTTQPTSPTIQQSTNSNSTVQPTPKTGDYSPSYTYTVPNSSSTAQGTTSIAAPDPSKCPGIRAQMASATATFTNSN